ncbi:hypothetical protein AGABI1DRAFT_127469 [Agaricus bisporus var. burnettii JB137-S8]|uniref:F-box domain-containing protein n=1 Tax=Agaricus bisporus var. burnettii (strain JB137-S8 / ATCC MYA-4627 / FGSC 10392) TaxID=597362 RepID=K5X9S3_AGABU|nr:uncharacterized protein AGABI1DRAFT_127469 [Agaricus bisporus var. burnettii JB137-S8]EKM79787.1 hypothetical protein AGABI1DRAFT_127469 [Agaricus bisporus var. burnettii JB137-S8]
MAHQVLKQNITDVLAVEDDFYLNTTDEDLIDAEISAHEVLLHSLTERIAALKNHRNSLSRAWRLPVEVLSDIMFAATNISIKESNEAEVYPTTLPVPLVLGQVCTAWRELAWKLPELWATIPLAIDKSRYSKQAALLDEWLTRAGDRQELYIIITLCKDESELQYWRDYPPKEILSRLYRCSNQWHTFYSTVPNLCFDLLASVHKKLNRLHTLILHRSGRFPYEIHGGLQNLGHPAQFAIGPPVIPGAIVNVNNGAGAAAPGGAAQPQQPLQVPIQNIMQPPGPLGGISLDDDFSHQRNPWYMLSDAPSLRNVVLPDALHPCDISLPWSKLTHLEVRTIPIDDCLRVLQLTPRIVSFDFHGIFSGPLIIFPTPHLHLNHLRKFSIFSDPTNLSRFLGALTTPNLSSINFKSTTGSLSIVTSQLTQLVQRSGCRMKQLKICIPSIGKSEEQIVRCLMGDEFRWVEELGLESWQADVEGLSDSFLRKMNPERRVRSVRTYSYPIESSSSGVADGSIGGSGGGSAASGGSGGPVIISPGWVEGPRDEIREPAEQEVEVPEGEWVEPHEILLPNLLVMSYKGTLSFTPQVLKDTLLARWKRKTRKRTVPQLVSLTNSNEGVDEAEEVWIFEEEEDWYPTAELSAFEIIAPEEMDFRQPIDKETNLVFRQMLRDGFYLSIETKRGVLAF